MVKLVCIDVDGTLIGSSGTVLPVVWDAAERARRSGLRLALCSGRPGFGPTREYAVRLDPTGWHVFQNGASVVDVGTGESRSARIAHETVAILVARARRTGDSLELYDDHGYAVERDSAVARAHAGLLGVPFVSRSFDGFAPVVRAQWLGSRDTAEAIIEDTLRLVTRDSRPGLEVLASTSPVMPDAVFINMTPPGVTKASAIATLAAAYRIDVAEVMFVGDGLNDVGALKVVGHPVAMGNAEPEVIAVAKAKVGHVDDGGLAQALELAIAQQSV